MTLPTYASSAPSVNSNRRTNFHAALEDLFIWAAAQNEPVSRAELLYQFKKLWDAPQSLSAVLSELLGLSKPERSLYRDLYGSRYTFERTAPATYLITRKDLPEEPNYTDVPGVGDLLEVTNDLDLRRAAVAYIVTDEFGRDWLAVLTPLQTDK